MGEQPHETVTGSPAGIPTSSSAPGAPELLTEFQTAVARQMARGVSDSGMAARFGMSEGQMQAVRQQVIRLLANETHPRPLEASGLHSEPSPERHDDGTPPITGRRPEENRAGWA